MLKRCKYLYKDVSQKHTRALSHTHTHMHAHTHTHTQRAKRNTRRCEYSTFFLFYIPFPPKLSPLLNLHNPATYIRDATYF